MSYYDSNCAKLVKEYTQSVSISFKGHKNCVTSCSYSPCGKYVMSGSNDSTVKIWSVEDEECVKTIQLPNMITSCSYSPCGQYAAITYCNKDDTFMMVSINTGKTVKEFIGHQDTVASCAFTPCGKKMVTSSYDHTVKIWDVDTCKCLITITTPNSRSNVISTNGVYIAWTGKVWDIENGKCVGYLNGDHITSYTFTPCGKSVIYGDGKGCLMMFNIKTNKVTKIGKHDGLITSCSVSSCGKYLAASSINSRVIVWHIDKKTWLKVIKNYESIVNQCSFSPCGRFIVSCSVDGLIKIHNIYFINEMNDQIDEILLTHKIENPSLPHDKAFEKMVRSWFVDCV